MLSKKSFVRTIVMYFAAIMAVVIAGLMFSGSNTFANDTLLSGDYEYKIYGDEVYITNYLGNDEDVVIPSEINGKTVTHIHNFRSSSMVSVDIPNTVKVINDNAFGFNDALETVIMNDNPEGTFEVAIGRSAFHDCKKLKNVILSENVSDLGAYAFSNTAIESIIIPKSVKKCGNCSIYSPGPFNGCESLTTVIFEAGITSIPGNICASDKANGTPNHIKTVIIPDSVTSIGICVFQGCADLEKIAIPSSVTEIGQGAFYGCEKLTEIKMPEQLAQTKIGARTFNDCKALKEITIPETITEIGESAFEGCSSLQRIIIPNSVTSIGYAAFYKCSFLDSVLIPKSVVKISSKAFEDTSFTAYVFKDSYAEKYFKENDFECVVMDEDSEEYFKLREDNNQFSNEKVPLLINNNVINNKLGNSTYLFDELLNICKNYGQNIALCHGIAVSMCLGTQGLLDFNDITPGAFNYATLGSPYTNNNFKDVLIYYSLQSFAKDGKPTVILDNNNKWFDMSLEERTILFFSGLISEAKRGTSERKPFLFSYNNKVHNNDGHTLVVCGYNWNEALQEHELKIYDLNSFGYDQENEMKGTFYTLSIDKSLKFFRFQDFNAKYGNYNIQDVWSRLTYTGIDKLYGNKGILDGKYFAASTSDRTTSIQVSAYKKFRLENAKGEYLAYDGENYSGNMKIYDCYTYGLDDSLMWNITVAESTEFKLTKAEDGCQLIATIGGQGYAVTANGADKVSISSAGISTSGKDYTLDAYVQSKNNDIIRLQAEADGKTTIKKNSGKIVVNSDSYCKDTTVCRFSEGEKEEIDPSKVSDKKAEIETGDEIILPFTDVKKGRWFYEYVEYVYKKRIMTGLNATTFGPEDNITRAMVVTVLWRMAGDPEPVSKGKVFPDVPTGKWYSKAVAWAKENKIVSGYSTGLFGTNDNIIRQDFVKILKGYTDYIGAEIPADTFESYTVKEDAKDVSGYAREYVQWAFQRSIIGQGSGLNPKGFLTRAETATMIMRFEVKASAV